eukprot:354186-Chlamydomonas_euryale.AAC.10
MMPTSRQPRKPIVSATMPRLTSIMSRTDVPSVKPKMGPISGETSILATAAGVRKTADASRRQGVFVCVWDEGGGQQQV